MSKHEHLSNALHEHDEAFSEFIENGEEASKSNPRLQAMAHRLQIAFALDNRKQAVADKAKKKRRKAGKVARQSRRYNLRHSR